MRQLRRTLVGRRPACPGPRRRHVAPRARRACRRAPASTDRGVDLRLLALWALLGTALPLASGCRETSPALRDGGRTVVDCAQDAGDEQCDEASRDNALFTWARSMCGFLFDCCHEAERWPIAERAMGAQGLQLLLFEEPTLLEDPLACRRGVALSLFSRFGASLRADEDGRQRFDRAMARECLDWFAAGHGHCAPGLVLLSGDQEPKACRSLFAPRVEPGGECYAAEDCTEQSDGGALICASRTEVRSDGGVRYAVRGVCKARPARGEACAFGSTECSAADSCAPDGRCQARAAVGALCVGAPCTAAAYCDTAQALPRCVARRSAMSPCSSTEQCLDGLTCVTELHVCAAVPQPSPLDVEFDVCLGDAGTPVARTLPFVPRDGGL